MAAVNSQRLILPAFLLSLNFFQEVDTISLPVASRWRILDNETKIYCANIAKRELCSYKEEIKQYKTSVAAAEHEQS